MDSQSNKQHSQNNLNNLETNTLENLSLIQENFQFRPPSKNPNEVFDKQKSNLLSVMNLSANASAIEKKQQAMDNEDDNKSQTSQKSMKSQGSSVGQRRRKGSFLDKLSVNRQEQEQKLQQIRKNDAKSIFLENVDYKTTKEQLELIFQDCGKIARITILKDPFTNHPKGCAYVSFQTEAGVQRALHLSGVSLRNRTIKVHRKRTNLPGLHHKGKKQDINKNFLGIMQSYTINVMRGRGRGRGR